MGQIPYDDLEQVFKALANVNRLKLLDQLSRPRGYGDIDLQPSRDDPAGSPDRPISRPAIRRHLQKLIEVGVVHEQDHGNHKRFLVDHARLFALLQQATDLATVQPEVHLDGQTMDLDASRDRSPSSGPHLVLVRGVREGQTFDLNGHGERWTIGRRQEAEISLDYDAYVSGQHATVLAKDGGHVLVDLPENRNGTRVNWQTVKPGVPVPLSPGDVIGVGMSLLVYRWSA